MAVHTFSKSTFARQLEEKVNELFGEYEQALKYDEQTARASLKFGQALQSRKGNRFMTEQGRARAKERCVPPLHDALGLIDAARKSVTSNIAHAPATDALAALQAIAVNPHPNAETLQAIADAYGKDNYLVNEAVEKIAREHGLNVQTSNETFDCINGLDALKRIVGGCDYTYIEGNSLSAASLKAIVVEDIRDFAANKRIDDIFSRAGGANGAIQDGEFSISWQ